MLTGKFGIDTKEIQYQTAGEEIDLIDLTVEIELFLKNTPIKEGRLTVFIPGSTGSILTTEYEPRLNQDTKRVMQALVPKGDGYRHDHIDNNAHSHLRSTLLGSELTVPVINGRLSTGTWQQICFADFDTHPRHRRLIFQIMGIVADETKR